MNPSARVPGSTPEREIAGVDPQAEILGLTVVLLDLLWLHPLLVLLAGAAPDGTPRITLWPLVAVAVLARVVVWLLERLGLAGRTYQVAAGAVGLCSLAGLLWVEFYSGAAGGDVTQNFVISQAGVVVAGGYLWWRTLQGTVPGLGALYDRFGWIIGTYVAYVFAGWLGQAAFLTPVLTRDLFGVFLAGLWAFALARSRMEGARSHQLLSTRWFVFSLGLIAVVLVAGLLVGGLFADDLVGALFGPLRTGVQLLGLLALALIYAIAAPILFLLDLLFGGIHPGPPPVTPTPTPGPDLNAQIQNLLQQQPEGAPPDTTLITILGVIIVAIIAALLARAVLGSAQHRRRALADGERESLLDWRTVLQSLIPHRAASTPAPDPLLALGRDPAYRHTVRIRQAYRQALARAATRDIARAPAQTADEVLPTLQTGFPAARAPLADLTRLYDATRYTATPALAADADAAERALRALDAPPDTGH